MKKETANKGFSKGYFAVIMLLMLLLPIISIAIDTYYNPDMALMALTGKWFVFWAIGVRLFTAGLRQAAKPAFTAQHIFHINDAGSQVIVRELGFANVCMGLIGILSILLPGWCPAAAFVGGLYMGIAGVHHIIKKPAGANEVIAMVSDLFIFLVMAIYLYWYFVK
ncbi:DUF6790 family protein [Mucilaginibacter gotjawali]|uniref:Uncharacterized protein n=2 Tax=Mucilaginibacter gotjawali TaxID=1550579 RepID=A0A839SQB9_9SPHI|nr:DUF6790 family protein [Mucilaginibacter gotjawali]MBB3059020.1 hypothetical protein [Mucilaginibacter gotjawali]BAU55799.1 hypothetical protein MgSA37_03991 [Mucilaginibacter gotjawali]